MEINKAYLNNTNQIKRALHENKAFPSVILQEFFKEESFQKLKKKVDKIPFKKSVKLTSHSLSKANLKISLNDFMETVLNQKVEFTAYLLEWKDYLLINDNFKEKPGYEVIIEIDNWNTKYGGNVHYVNGKGDYLQIPARKNSLIIVKREHQKFIKYVNHLAKGKKRFFLLGKVKP